MDREEISSGGVYSGGDAPPSISVSETTLAGEKELTIQKEKLSTHPSRKVNHTLGWEVTKRLASHIMGCHIGLTRHRPQSKLGKTVHKVQDVRNNSTTFASKGLTLNHGKFDLSDISLNIHLSPPHGMTKSTRIPNSQKFNNKGCRNTRIGNT